MKEGWEYKKLGEVCEILDSRRKPITKNKRESGTIPYYGATGILDYVKDYIFDEKLVLLGEDGAKWGAGENSAYIVEGKTWVNNHAHALRPKRDLLKDELLVYYLNFSNLLPYITGVTVPKLNQEKMRSIEIPIGPITEQQSIVDYLDSAFAKIDAMKANAEKALGEAKALFQASLKETLEPKEGWEEKKLGDIVSFFSGYAFESKRYTNNNDDILLICGDNIVHCDFRWETMKHWPKEEYDDLKRFSLEKNDIVLAMDRPWVKSGLKIAKITPKELPSLLIQRTACIRAPKDISSDFVFYALQTEKFIKHLVSQQNGVGVPHISGKQILSYKISIPKYVEQQSIVATLDSLKSKVDRLKANYDKISQECDALKQAILRQVFE